MKITRVEYPVCGKKKYNVIYNNKEYTCYICSCMPNLVVTGDGNAENFEDITNTNLGMKIILKCYHVD